MMFSVERDVGWLIVAFSLTKASTKSHQELLSNKIIKTKTLENRSSDKKITNSATLGNYLIRQSSGIQQCLSLWIKNLKPNTQQHLPPTTGLNDAPPNSAQTPIPYTDACSKTLIRKVIQSHHKITRKPCKSLKLWNRCVNDWPAGHQHWRRCMLPTRKEGNLHNICKSPWQKSEQYGWLCPEGCGMSSRNFDGFDHLIVVIDAIQKDMIEINESTASGL